MRLTLTLLVEHGCQLIRDENLAYWLSGLPGVEERTYIYYCVANIHVHVHKTVDCLVRLRTYLHVHILQYTVCSHLVYHAH